MQRIESFAVNHDLLDPGVYLSRTDGDTVTFDIRMKKPNGGDYLSYGVMHPIEHLLATYVRNSPLANAVIYAGPMGCRTGFYLVMRDSAPTGEVIGLIRGAMAYIAAFTGDIPGNSRQECGHYEEHDLAGAKRAAAAMAAVLKNWTTAQLAYKQSE